VPPHTLGDTSMTTDFKFNSPEHIAAQATDDAWSMELQRLFGKRAGDVRYTPQGKGGPGTALRAAYEAREAARKAYDCAISH
jgi:hypothetical protein